jgi:GTP-binding protein EngB required for normal cell division
MMIWYFEYSEVKSRMAVIIIDSVVGLKELDKQMIDFLSELKIDFIIAANKIDKLSKQKRDVKIDAIRKDSNGATVIPYSAKTHDGRKTLLSYLKI